MQILVVGLSIACFVSFAWAIHGHFQRHDGMATGMRLVSFLSLLGFAWFLVARLRGAPMLDNDRLYPDTASCLLLCAALSLFWLSIYATRANPLTLAFAIDVPTFLQRRGPYKHVRHPFYLSYLLFWIGTAVASSSPLHWVMPAIMVPLYVIAARREEQKFASSTMAPAYDDYRQRTGMLVPRLWRQLNNIH